MKIKLIEKTLTIRLKTKKETIEYAQPKSIFLSVLGIQGVKGQDSFTGKVQTF